jgi:tetratricopeptide (TPR) repeat protein
LLLAWLRALTIVPIYDPDVWFHLGVGKWVIDHHAVPHANLFMYTTPDYPWIDHSWLSEALFYLGYRLVGPGGMPLLIALVVAGAAGLMWRLWFRLGGRAALAPVAFGLALLSASTRFNLRPELFTLLGLSVLLSIIHVSFARGRSGRFPWALPVLAVVWANLHGGWVSGIAVVWVFVGGEAAGLLWDRFRGRPVEGSRLRRLAQWAVIATAATVVNPYGYHWFEAVDPRRLRAFSHLLDEWTPAMGPRSVALIDAVRPNALLALLALTVVTVIAAGRRVTVSSVALLLFAIAIALGARRNSGLAAWICLPILAVESRAAMAGFAGRALATWGRVWQGRLRLSYRLVIVVALAAGAGHLWVRGIIPELRPGLGVNEARLPIGAMKFIEQVHLRGPMFNMYGQGAYLIWQWAPREKVFIDGLNAYPMSWLEQYNELVDGQKGPASAIASWRLNYFLLDEQELGGRPEPSRLTTRLDGLGWRLVYYDGRDFIYVADTPENQGLIARYAYHYLRPLSVSASVALDHPVELKAEVERMIAGNPQSPHAHDAAAWVFASLGELSAAVEEWEAEARLSRNPAPAYLQLGRAYAAAGQPDRALDYYRRAARLSPRNAEVHRRLADFHESAGRFPEAIAERKRVIRLERGNPAGHFALAQTYGSQAQMPGAPKDRLLRRQASELQISLRLGAHAVTAQALGTVYLELGEPVSAIREFERGIVLDPTWVANYVGLAQAQELAGSRQGAIDAWNRVLAHEPDADTARLAQDRLRVLRATPAGRGGA